MDGSTRGSKGQREERVVSVREGFAARFTFLSLAIDTSKALGFTDGWRFFLGLSPRRMPSCRQSWRDDHGNHKSSSVEQSLRHLAHWALSKKRGKTPLTNFAAMPLRFLNRPAGPRTGMGWRDGEHEGVSLALGRSAATPLSEARPLDWLTS